MNVKVIVVIFLVYFANAKAAHAYLDPGTGSYILQIMLGSVVAGGYFFKDKLKSVLDFFKKKLKK